MTASALPSTKPEPRTRPKPDQKPDPDPPRRWNVVLLDDQDHTYEYVIRMVCQLFGRTPQAAFKIAEAVDKQGRAVCLTTHKEHAEFKRDQIHAFGADPLMVSSRGSMSATIEPAEFDGDGDEDGKGGKDGNGGPDAGRSGDGRGS